MMWSISWYDVTVSSLQFRSERSVANSCNFNLFHSRLKFTTIELTWFDTGARGCNSYKWYVFPSSSSLKAGKRYICPQAWLLRNWNKKEPLDPYVWPSVHDSLINTYIESSDLTEAIYFSLKICLWRMGENGISSNVRHLIMGCMNVWDKATYRHRRSPSILLSVALDLKKL